MEHSRILPAERVSAPIPMPGAIPPLPAVTRILSHFTRPQVESFIEIAVAMLDVVDGDPDAEPNGDDEPLEANGDTRDAAWIEWHNMRGAAKRGPNIASENEDDEEDNEDCGLDEGEPHFVSLSDVDAGAGCPIADPGGCEHDGREPGDDEEREQMGNDVPMLPVYSLDHNPFTDKRVYLGRSNMMSSFVVGGDGERSADTGAIHKGGAPSLLSRPGVPV